MFCILPLALFSQVYRYTKETRIEYNGKNATDTMYILQADVRVDVQITKNNITVTRPRNGSGEPLSKDVYTIKKIAKGDVETKITTKQGYIMTIYHNAGITLHYRKDANRIEYSFYNPSNMPFRYE